MENVGTRFLTGLCKADFILLRSRCSPHSLFLIPKELLNTSDFCDKRLKYRDFYRKNHLKSEVS